jgi:hypothetical protein
VFGTTSASVWNDIGKCLEQESSGQYLEGTDKCPEATGADLGTTV